MNALRNILLILGVLCAVGFLTGVQQWSWASGGGVMITRYQGWQRVCALIGSLLCFSWAVGIGKRQIWAWYFGCLVFILGIVQVTIFQGLLLFLRAPASFDGWWAMFSQDIFALILFLIMRKWWIPKKQKYFVAEIEKDGNQRRLTD